MLDAVVVGGGPAGSTVGSALSRLGYDVLLLEREAFPRHHIGESMLPASLELLDAVGALDDVRDAGFPVKRGGVFVWGRSREPWLFRFGERRIGTAFQVERGKFDSILVANAQRQGVDVRMQHRAVDLLTTDGRVCGVTFTDEQGRSQSVQSRWVLDASGQAGFLGSKRKSRIINDDLRNMALYGYWRGRRGVEVADLCGQAGAEDRNSIFIESSSDGWCWWIPLDEHYFSVGAIVGKGHHGKRTSTEIRQLYHDVVRGTEFVRRFVSQSKFDEPIRVIRDWSYRSSEFCGRGFAMLGDAAAFVDPILSTGVFLALNSAVAFATVINTISKGMVEEDACLDWYRRIYNAVYDDYEAMAKHWYFGERTQDSWFWRARRAISLDDQRQSFRNSFVLLASGLSHSVRREFVSAEAGDVAYLSQIDSMGAMGSPSALRTIASNLALDLPEALPADNNSERDLQLALIPASDWTLSYALVRPDGSRILIPAMVAQSILDLQGRR
jgi:FAD-dependent halogenase